MTRFVGVTLALLVWTAPALAQDTQPPPIPTSLQVGPAEPGLNTVAFRLTWPVVLDPPSNQPVPTYTWGAGFSDGQGSTGSVAYADMTPGSPAMNLTMPYHLSGLARTGFACIRPRDAAGNLGVDAAGNADQTCAPLAVPARPAQPAATTTVRVRYTEPSTNADGTPLTDLATVRISYRMDGGAEQSIDFQATRLQGGQAVATSFVVGANTGILTMQASALDLVGNESGRSTTVTTDLAAALPGVGGVNVITITIPGVAP